MSHFSTWRLFGATLVLLVSVVSSIEGKAESNARQTQAFHTSLQIGHVWCRYQSNEKTITETRCNVVVEPQIGCKFPFLGGRYTLIFSELSRAIITDICDRDNPDQVNGQQATFEEIRVVGRTYYRAYVGAEETFDFEKLGNPPLPPEAPSKPLWSDAWQGFGELGYCYFNGPRASSGEECIRHEVCHTSSDSGEGGCGASFRSRKKLLYEYNGYEETYSSGDHEFGSWDIRHIAGATCYPISKKRDFCFEAQRSLPETTPVPTPAPRKNPGSGFDGDVYVGSVAFGMDNTNFVEFLSRNTLKIVYLDVGVGYDINLLAARGISERCNGFYYYNGKKVERSYDRTQEYLYLGLSRKDGNQIACGDFAQLDLEHASTDQAATGTGLYIFPVTGFFKVSRLGRWNDFHATFRLESIDADYETHQAAQVKARAVKSDHVPVRAPLARRGIVNRGWFVQIATGPTQEAAQSLSVELATRFSRVLAGRDIQIFLKQTKLGAIWRLRLTASTREEAKRFCGEYKTAGGASCFAVRDTEAALTAVPQITATQLQAKAQQEVRRRLADCWVIPLGLDSNFKVSLKFKTDAEGNVLGIPTVKGIMPSGKYAEAFVESAKRTLLRCAPYTNLHNPSELVVNFDTSDLF